MKIPQYLSFTRNKTFVTCVAIFFLILLFFEYRQVSQMRSVQKEIAELNKQAEYFNKTNQSLSSSLSSYDSEFNKEKVARDQLNLKKDGEQVYSYAQNGVVQDQTAPVIPVATPADSAQSQAPKQDSNPKKWWNYFFNPQL